MPIPLEVEIADSKSYLLHEVCRNCEIIIEDEKFAIDLIPMILGEFKVIVGMDWLAKHQAEIQCEKKVIHVLTSGGKRVKHTRGKEYQFEALFYSPSIQVRTKWKQGISNLRGGY